MKNALLMIDSSDTYIQKTYANFKFVSLNLQEKKVWSLVPVHCGSSTSMSIMFDCDNAFQSLQILQNL